MAVARAARRPRGRPGRMVVEARRPEPAVDGHLRHRRRPRRRRSAAENRPGRGSPRWREAPGVRAVPPAGLARPRSHPAGGRRADGGPRTGGGRAVRRTAAPGMATGHAGGRAQRATRLPAGPQPRRAHRANDARAGRHPRHARPRRADPDDPRSGRAGAVPRRTRALPEPARMVASRDAAGRRTDRVRDPRAQRLQPDHRLPRRGAGPSRPGLHQRRAGRGHGPARRAERPANPRFHRRR